jgi:hypothetical protein
MLLMFVEGVAEAVLAFLTVKPVRVDENDFSLSAGEGGAGIGSDTGTKPASAVAELGNRIRETDRVGALSTTGAGAGLAGIAEVATNVSGPDVDI